MFLSFSIFDFEFFMSIYGLPSVTKTFNNLVFSLLFTSCRRFETGGSLGRRVKCRRVPQPRWVGARRSAKGGRRRPERERERWKSRGLRVCPAPRSGALAVGGYKRPRRRGASGLTRALVPSSSPRGQPSVRGPWSFLL
jgi:hypothetical protein